MALSIAIPTASQAGPTLPPNADLSLVSEPLKPWIPWVLRDLGDDACPGHEEDSRVCIATSKLSIQADKKGASFTLSGTRYSPGRVQLPGDSAAWPVEVRDRGLSIPVVGDDEDQPFVERPAGAFAITGRLTWKKRPASLSLPADIAIRQLSVDGKTAAFDVEESRMWLETQLSEDSEGDEDALDTISSLEIRVQRLLQDGSPMELVTTLELVVGGKERRIQLPGVIPANSRAVELNSSLAGRLDGKGGLELTLRPGTWNVVVKSLLSGTPSLLEVNKAPDPWPFQEVWSFRENANLRGLSFEGAPAVNPIQAGLDASLRNLPAWSLDSSHPLRIKVVRQGAIHPDSMKVSLERILHLDANGPGATVEDRYALDSWRPTRFSLRAPLDVSRMVPYPGGPSLITSIGSDEAGINLYNYTQSVTVLGRFADGSWRQASASGTATRLEKLRLDVKAPAGWWIVALTGIDGAEEYSTWRSLWSETELVYAAILVGLLYLAVGRMAALLAMVFLAAGRFDLVGTSAWMGLAIVLFLRSLSDRLPDPKREFFRRILNPLVVIGLAWSAWSLVSDSSAQWIRISHPSARQEAPASGNSWIPRIGTMAENKEMDIRLDTTAVVEAYAEAPAGSSEARTISHPPTSPASVMSSSVMDRMEESSDQLLGEDVDPNATNMIDVILAGGGGLKKGDRKHGALGDGDRMARSGRIGLGSDTRSGVGIVDRGRKVKPDIAAKRERDPFLDGVIQTGPGIPSLSGTTARLESGYPVAADAKVRIWTLGTNVVRAVRLLGILMGWMLLVHIVRRRSSLGVPSIPSTTPVAGALALLVMLAPAPAVAQAMPSSEMLEELKGTLTRAPDCEGSCADISRIAVASQGPDIRLECNLQALATTTLQLPQGDWTLVDISCPTCSFGSSGNAPFAVVTKGTHTLTMVGRPSGKELVFSFPVRPRVLEVNTAGWVRLDDGRGSLHLSRAKGAAAIEEVESPDPRASNLGASPFVRIERRFQFSREWTVATRLVRSTQFEGAIAIDYPLLPGESTLDGQAIDSGKARWVLPSGEKSAEFHTKLRHDDSLVLVARTGPWAETWNAQAHPRLQILHKGMPVTQRGELVWTPFPGDTLKLFPKAWPAAKGPHLTLLGAKLTQSTDPRDPSGTLEFQTLLSQGSDIQVRIPADAQLEWVRRNGIDQNPTRLPDGRLNIPLTTDTRQVSVSWRIPGQNPFLGRSPRVELSVGGVDFSAELKMASNRFVLLSGGEGEGVRCLWWAFLPLLLGLAWGLWKWSASKVGILQAALVLVPVSTIQDLGSSPLWLFLAGLVWVLVWRERADTTAWPTPMRRLLQAGIIAMAGVVAIALIRLVASPLIGSPDFQPIATTRPWTWMLDRSAGSLPSAWAITLPVWMWKVALGLWLVWLVRFALPWVRKGWSVFTMDGLWPTTPGTVDESFDEPGVKTTPFQEDDSESEDSDR